ncbi:MAG: hypothetical protein GY856_31360, partial [bacterium]|nr:hypothetical protein [bacterium]
MSRKPGPRSSAAAPNYGPHVTVSEVAEEPAASVEAVVDWWLAIHLSAGCKVCWQSVREAADRCDLTSSFSRLRSALAKVVEPRAEVLNRLAPRHRAAVREASGGGPGFCFLLLEESTVGARYLDWRSELPSWLAPAAVAAASLDDPVVVHDLMARQLVWLTKGLCAQGELVPATRALKLARLHADSGRGDAEPRASVLEAAALVAAKHTESTRCLALVDEALAVLAEYPMPDRRAEVLFHVARALGDHGEEMPEPALTLLRRAAAEIDRLDRAVNPRLRIKIVHHLALAETGRVMRALMRGATPDKGVLERMEARMRELAALDPEGGDNGVRAQRLMIRGRLALAGEPEQAAPLFARALSFYEKSWGPCGQVSPLVELLDLTAHGRLPVPGKKPEAAFFASLWREVRDSRSSKEVIRHVLGARAARAPAAGAALSSALAET